MTSKNRLFVVVTLPVCAAILVAGAGFASAGDLNPPVGPVAPTQRTPVNANMTPGDADSLFKITQRGSYYLTGNILGFAGKHGIEIAASGVTLDLNGFDLAGVPAMGAFDGVSATVASLTNIAVVNGSVRNWGGDGVDLGTSLVNGCRVADVIANGNTGNGINTFSASTVSNCSAANNTGHGIITFIGCTVSNCSVYNNTGNGFSASNGCTFSNCYAFSNTSIGINAASGSTVVNCAASGNISNGIYANVGSTVTNCAAYTNTGIGINASDGSSVIDCTARFNTLDGIRCFSQCVIRGNTCSSNGNGAGFGAGIRATGSDNRIEGNNCTDADRGIHVTGPGNIIIKNTCSGNTTNWDISFGNAVAPIVNALLSGDFILGDTYAGSLGSTDPNANFTY